MSTPTGPGREHTTDWRAIACVGVGIEHEIGYAGRATHMERLVKTGRVKAGANRVRADDGDRLALIARRGNEAGGLTRRMDLNWVRVAHIYFLNSAMTSISPTMFSLKTANSSAGIQSSW